MNSLAPDWCNASPDATHYVIHADGAAEWLHVLGGGNVRIDDEAHCWSHDGALWWESAGHVSLPPGVDWRQTLLNLRARSLTICSPPGWGIWSSSRRYFRSHCGRASVEEEH